MRILVILLLSICLVGCSKTPSEQIAECLQDLFCGYSFSCHIKLTPEELDRAIGICRTIIENPPSKPFFSDWGL